jgi:hypothetical protein
LLLLLSATIALLRDLDAAQGGEAVTSTARLQRPPWSEHAFSQTADSPSQASFVHERAFTTAPSAHAQAYVAH